MLAKRESSRLVRRVRRAFQLSIVAVLMVSIGTHWIALQSLAWVGMAVTYTVQKGSLVEGLSDTFDGEHPCPLCHAVKKGVDSEQAPQKGAPTVEGKDLKLTLALEQVPFFVFPPVQPKSWSMTSRHGWTLPSLPLTPPPEPA